MAENENQKAGLVIQNQYIKDMSIEIPLAPEIFKEMTQAPEVHIDFNMKNNKLEDNFYEVVLNANIDANIGDKKLFIVELSYAAVVDINVPQESLEPVLYIELPRLLFPFVRSIIANSLSAAGLPPMMISPIDFVALYQAKKAQEAQEEQKSENHN